MYVNIHKIMFIYVLAICFYYAIAVIWSPWITLGVIAVEILARILLNAIVMQHFLDSVQKMHNKGNGP